MRCLLALTALAWTASAHAGVASNPAFLGIGMIPSPGGGCEVDTITPSSGAEAAGLRRRDVLFALDGVSIGSCAELSSLITNHAPGESIRLDVMRAGNAGLFAVHATLSSRAEILHRRFVGHALDSIDVTDVDEVRDFDLADLRGETTILAWGEFGRCAGCDSLVRHIAERVQAPRRGTAAARMLAITSGSIDELAKAQLSAHLGVPLAVVDRSAYEQAATIDSDRVFFMVLDSRGIVRFVAPIVPDDDAVEAQIDELLAAAEQAEHAHARK